MTDLSSGRAASRGGLDVDMDWLIFILFVTGCVYSWGALSKSPRKKTFGAVSVIIITVIYILAKFGLI